MNDNIRYYPVEIDRRTGCHQLLAAKVSMDYNKAVSICQCLAPVEKHKHRELFECHYITGDSK